MLIPIRWWAFIHSTYCLATILVFLQCFKALAFTVTSTLNPSGVMGPVDAQVDGSLKAIQSVAKPDRKVTCLGCWRWFGFWRGWSSLSSASTLTYSTALKEIMFRIQISTGSLMKWNTYSWVNSTGSHLDFYVPILSPVFTPWILHKPVILSVFCAITNCQHSMICSTIVAIKVEN